MLAAKVHNKHHQDLPVAAAVTATHPASAPSIRRRILLFTVASGLTSERSYSQKALRLSFLSLILQSGLITALQALKDANMSSLKSSMSLFALSLMLLVKATELIPGKCLKLQPMSVLPAPALN